MQDVIRTKRLGRVLAAAAVLIGVVAAGCGAGSGGPTSSASTADSASAAVSVGSSTTAGGAATSSGSTTPVVSPASGPLAFAECMRANGVPNFPDPSAGGTAQFTLPAGTSPAAPAFRAAQAKCRNLLPDGGPPGPGSTTHPSAQTLSKLVRIARCMRLHGVPQFPDPRTTVPSNPAGINEITDFDGAILLFPATMNMQAPAYRNALTACGAPPLGLRH
ncbi:MAG TPA: hypothetical protein VME22_22625 [Solirubrobacteraceae bacterium]|nr:hypothetical protein [Solirubrobacteraceae bacterium]